MGMERVTFRPSLGQSDVDAQLSVLLDAAFGPVQGQIIYRDAVEWSPLAPGMFGQVLNSGGPGGNVFWGGTVSYLAPAFTSFAITGVSSPIEVGSTFASGSYTFTWSTSNSANVQANSISIVDTTASNTLASGLANSGSDVISLSAITNSSPATQVWTINGTNTHSQGFSDTFGLTWLWRVFAGTNTAGTLTSAQIIALSASDSLQSSFPGTYTITTGSTAYYYFCYPDSMGSASRFFDVNSNFLISMATASDNAAYSNTANGYSYALVSTTNSQGASTNYRVYRTQYNFYGTLGMQVS